MATTLNLPYKRFVRQVSNGCARTKYSYQAMQTDLLAALKNAPWHAATCEDNEVTTVLNKVTESDRAVDSETGEETSAPSYTAYLKDKYDAFKQGGDAVTETASFCGYAGMVAYRYKLPATYDQNISSVTMRFTAARYLRSGLKVVLVLSDSATPSTDWDTVRGTASGAIATASTTSEADGVKTWGFAAQSDIDVLISSVAREETLTMTATDYAALGTSTRYEYLWVYVSVEDYEDWWDLYDAKTPRYYSIEGSAALVGGTLAVTFAGTVTVSSTIYSVDVQPGTFTYVLPHIMPYSGYTTRESDYVDKYGSFVKGIMKAGAKLQTDSSTNGLGASIGLMMAYDVLPRKNFFDSAGDHITALLTDGPKYDELGVFAAVLNGFTYREGSTSGQGTFSASVLYTGDVHLSFKGYEAIPTILGSASRFAYNSMIEFSGRVGVVPAGGEKFSKIKYVTTVTQTHGEFDAAVNVWRSRSPDAIGPWGMAILSAMMSYQDMYTGAKPSVSAELAGDGTNTTGMTLNATADLICTLHPDMTSSSSQTVTGELSSPVRPGDVLIFTPKLISVENYSQLPSVLMTPTTISLGE